MPVMRSFYILALLLFFPAMSFAEVSLADLNHTEGAGGTFDPGAGGGVRQQAPASGQAGLEDVFNSCFNGGRPDFSPGGGGVARDGLDLTVSQPIQVADADPELKKGGVFDLDKVKRSLLGADGLTGRCAKCHNTGKASPTINSATLDTPGGLARILKALTDRDPPMPKDNPGFRNTPEGLAVVQFLKTEVAKGTAAP